MARKVVGVGSVGRARGSCCCSAATTGPAVPAGQGGASRRCSSPSSARASSEPRPAGRRRATADAGRERHLPRLAAGRSGIDGEPRDFYVRQLHDWKGSADVDQMRVAGMTTYARVCGCDARARARALGRPDRDRRVPGQGRRLRPRDRRLRATYADQNERDYAAFVDAVQSGRLVAETGL